MQKLTDAVTVDWTTLQVEVRASAHTQNVGNLRSVEELARRNVARALEQALPEIVLTSTTRLGDVTADPTLGAPIAARQSRWQVTEARYAVSGSVTLLATVSLASIVKPWVLANAVADVPADRGGAFTGVLVDARATGITMAVAPRIVTESGLVVFDGGLDAFSAVTRVPVRYVASPDAPAVAAAGTRPWRLLATRVTSGGDLVVANVGPDVVARSEALVRAGEIIVVVRHR